jgi:cytochrome c oxidase accessory protein FixG
MGVMAFQFGWFREQFCTVLCPYARFQSVLMDAQSLLVGYDAHRGEPRGKLRETGKGDCIDCHLCVRVCPTGIDIRNGTQLECIACANCVDACDSVMRQIGRSPGLIRYDTENALGGCWSTSIASATSSTLWRSANARYRNICNRVATPFDI